MDDLTNNTNVQNSAWSVQNSTWPTQNVNENTSIWENGVVENGCSLN